MAKYNHSCRAPNTCGVGVISMFRKGAGTPISSFENPGGCGWLMAGFISDEDAAADHGAEAACTSTAYNDLKKKYKIRSQSPTRVNDNSGHQFFYCIYDTKSPLDAAGIKAHNAKWTWPF